MALDRLSSSWCSSCNPRGQAEEGSCRYSRCPDGWKPAMRLRLLQLLAIWSALGMTSASARQLAATLSGPSLGYLWSGVEGKLRPLHGILGNATIGDPMDLGFAITRAVALNGRHFLASIDDNPALMLLNMEKVPPTLTAIADAPEP